MIASTLMRGYMFARLSTAANANIQDLQVKVLSERETLEDSLNRYEAAAHRRTTPPVDS